MGFIEIEHVGKQMFEQFPLIKRSVKRAYQLASVATSKEKFKSEGDVVKISPDDKYEYFYGYYDKSPWDDSDRYMICIKVEQAYKFVAPKEPGIVGVIDTQNNNKFIEIGVTHSWNVQQSCMAQWMGPDYRSHILYNDFRDGHYCAVIYNFETRSEEKVLPMAAYDVARDGSFILSLDFSRLHRMRPGYGYSNLQEITKGELCSDKCCIWKVDIATCEITELFKYTDLAAFERDESMNGAEHKVNHLMISPNCKRFMLLHRWFLKGRKHTRLLTVNVDKTEMYNLSDDVFVSHCYWKNDNEILSFLRKKETGDHYYLLQDKTQEYKLYWPELNTDGHCSYSPDGKYIITDTYPNRKRKASVFLCTEDDNRSRRIARVSAPFRYDNDCRCDLHPRWNRTGDKVCIDSVHDGKRGMYVISVLDNLREIEEKRFLAKKRENSVSQKLVSFVIPAYNAESTIDRCLDSLLQQMDDSWEAIVVNDGSNDNTKEKLEKYKLHENIIVINQENAGPGPARNKGINNATSQYISFLDADDYLENDFVGLMHDLANKTNADVLFYEIIYEDQNGKEIKTSKIYNHASEDRDAFIISQLSGSFSWGTVKMIRRSIILEHKISFSSQTVGEEATFTFDVLCNSDRIEFLKKPIYHYIQSDQGQHKKGNDDPIYGAVHELKTHMIRLGLFEKYEVALNNMAMKALSMSLYRCSLMYGYFDAIKIMKGKIKTYRTQYNFKRIDTGKLNGSVKIVLPFIKGNFVTLIFVASKIRNRGNKF